MTEADVSRAAAATNTNRLDLCTGLSTVLPILRHLRDNAGMRFWISIGLGIAISALESFRSSRCSGGAGTA